MGATNMVMAYNSTKAYIYLVNELSGIYNVSKHYKLSLLDYVNPIYRADLENRYGEPMFWIGMYIALASLCCVLAMVADLVHGIRSKRLWFPCKYFSINAASLTVISVAMKLPVDLTAYMPGDVDQVAKLGSMAFMCTMMANLLPSLATMDSNALLANITALGVFVITMVVNVCIQMQTGVVSNGEDMGDTLTLDHHDYKHFKLLNINELPNATIATIYVTLLLVLLVIYVSSSLPVLLSQQIKESNFQEEDQIISKEVQKSLLTVEKLRRHLSNYWIMTGSESPQFVIVCSVTITAVGVICALTTILHTLTLCWTLAGILGKDFDSDYKWSTLVILTVQFVGVLIGMIVPLSRCFASIKFKRLSTKIILNHIKVFEVENYWIQKLYDWKDRRIPFPIHRHKHKVVIKNLKSLFLNFSIKVQEGVVVVCKIIALIPSFFMLLVLYILRCLKWLLRSAQLYRLKRLLPAVSTSSSGERINIRNNFQLEHEMQLHSRTLEVLSESLNQLFRKGVHEQPNNLMRLIASKSTENFQGIAKFDNNDHHVQCSPSKVEYRDSWSLPIVTLTTLAITLPDINREEVHELLKSVREGLEYVTLVEESLNATNDYLSSRNAAEKLWGEVDASHKWLGIYIKHVYSQVNATACKEDATMQIVQSFLERAENKIKEGVRRMDDGGLNGDTEVTFICANSMYRITKTIINYKVECQQELFHILASLIADIMAACLTNLPQVIAMKCRTNIIEEREAGVQVAVQLLGETEHMINILRDRGFPNMNPDDLPFIEKWCAYLCDP